MQSSNIIGRLSQRTVNYIQIRTHVKIYPWRVNRKSSESHRDNTLTPYTDRHNMNEFDVRKKKLKPWQKVIPKDKDNQYNAYRWDESYRSDPKEARETAHSKLNRLVDSLRERGQARLTKRYVPPDNVQKTVLDIYRGIDNQNSRDEDSLLMDDIGNNKKLKFNFLNECIKYFDKDISVVDLNEINTVTDVVEHFSTPVRGVDPYTALMNQNDMLPANLTLIAEPLRYNVENDTFFRGYNALPGIKGKVPGLRASKKYPILNQDEHQWPDI